MYSYNTHFFQKVSTYWSMYSFWHSILYKKKQKNANRMTIAVIFFKNLTALYNNTVSSKLLNLNLGIIKEMGRFKLKKKRSLHVQTGGHRVPSPRPSECLEDFLRCLNLYPLP